MNEPTTSFPEYGRAHLSDDCRACFLGAASCWNAAHEALLRDDKHLAFDQMEMCLALAIEARKLLIAQGVQKPSEPVAESSAPLQCKHGTPLDIACVECIHDAEEKT